MPADDKSHSMPQMVSKRCSIETTDFWWNVRILENWKIIITEICKISKPRGVTTRGNVSKSIYGHNFGGLANFHSTQKYFTICTQIIVPTYEHLRKNQHSIFSKKVFLDLLDSLVEFCKLNVWVSHTSYYILCVQFALFGVKIIT